MREGIRSLRGRYERYFRSWAWRRRMTRRFWRIVFARWRPLSTISNSRSPLRNLWINGPMISVSRIRGKLGNSHKLRIVAQAMSY